MPGVVKCAGPFSRKKVFLWESCWLSWVGYLTFLLTDHLTFSQNRHSADVVAVVAVLLTFTEHLLSARHFAYIISFNLPENSLRWCSFIPLLGLKPLWLSHLTKVKYPEVAELRFEPEVPYQTPSSQPVWLNWLKKIMFSGAHEYFLQLHKTPVTYCRSPRAMGRFLLSHGLEPLCRHTHCPLLPPNPSIPIPHGAHPALLYKTGLPDLFLGFLGNNTSSSRS